MSTCCIVGVGLNSSKKPITRLKPVKIVGKFLLGLIIPVRNFLQHSEDRINLPNKVQNPSSPNVLSAFKIRKSHAKTRNIFLTGAADNGAFLLSFEALKKQSYTLNNFATKT